MVKIGFRRKGECCYIEVADRLKKVNGYSPVEHISFDGKEDSSDEKQDRYLYGPVCDADAQVGYVVQLMID